jgi:signal transduction histidine kinase
VPFDQASVILFDFEDESASVFAYVDGDSPEAAGSTVPLDPEWVSRLGKGQTIVNEDLSSLQTPPPCLECLRREGLRSAVVVPLFVKRRLVGVLNLARREKGGFPNGHIEIAEELGASLAVSLQNARLMESARRSHEELRALRARLAESEEAARRRIARELHDRVGQCLTALSVNLGMVRKQIGPDCAATLQERLDDCVRLVREIGNQIEGVTDELRPAILDDYGLTAGLRWYGDQFAKRTGVSVTVRSSGSSSRLAKDIQTALFRICQEALTNVAKHAQASNVLIRVTIGDGKTCLSVRDDGTGIDIHKTKRRHAHGRWGLITMRERALSVGGSFEARPAEPVGTEIVVEVPDSVRHGQDSTEREAMEE